MKYNFSLFDPEPFRTELKRLCEKVSNCWGIKGLAQALQRDFHYFDTTCIVSRLGQTVKTHKPQGKVVMRALHSSTSSPLKPLYCFVAGTFRGSLHERKHIVKSSVDFRKCIEQHVLGPTDMLWEIDIADLFMTGDHSHIASIGSNVLEPPWQSPFRALLLFLLKNQFVTDGFSHARVITGSGMGLEMSGDLCDFFLLVLVRASCVRARLLENVRYPMLV